MIIGNILYDKIAIVTGGAQGIGKAITKLFAEHGAKVIIVDIVDEQAINENIKGKIDYLKLDVSKEGSWAKIEQHFKLKYNKLNILINNAGINAIDEIQDPENMSLKTWNYIQSVNLDSVFLGCRSAIKLMKTNQENCSIINISSRSGVIATPNLAAYSATKAAARNYTQSVAIYCAQQGYKIRCNTISPAAIDTNMWDQQKKDREQFQEFVTSLPLKRLGNVKEVAYAALYLASDESLYTTGTEIIIDGGILSSCASRPK